MKFLLLYALVLLTGICIAQTDYQNHMVHYRDSINQEFGDPELSILEEGDVKGFQGLDFFPISQKFVVKAKVEKIVDGEVFEMATSTERRPKYKPAIKLKFEIDGKPQELIAYQSVKLSEDPEYVNYLFLPFTDQTNGDESYGGGRYLELDGSGFSDFAEIDFNKCYNPYCSYNGKYSCPVPPKENRLNVKIEAGVKAYDHR
ncbi:MAG: hypothetical protein ACI85F_001814 [Bacteroidia bacterium]|jgi:uncharacterized protein (DUF1684 family)